MRSNLVKAKFGHCSSENVRFWCAVNDYKEKFDEEAGDDEGELKTGEATALYRTFIDHRSNSQVNLSSKQKGDIKRAIDSGRLTRETFDAAQKEIFSVMSRDSYPRFMASKKNRVPQ